MANLENTIKTIKDKLPDVTPTPPDLHAHATAHELKSRLNWGEPALTILDVRDHAAFNECRILGAVTLPMDRLSRGDYLGLEANRDIYVYGANDEETKAAADQLRSAGFVRVSELQGGIAAWQEIGGPIEGLTTRDERPSAGDYNVVSRLKDFADEKAKENAQK